MNDYLDLGIKGITSVIILYFAFNTIMRYHTSIRVETLTFLSAFSVVNFFYFDRVIGLTYWIIVGLMGVGYGALRLYFYQKQKATYFLIGLLDKDQSALSEELESIRQNLNVAQTKFYVLPERPYVVTFMNTPRATQKAYMTAYEKAVASNPKPFTLIQYFSVVIALILLVIIWRY
jgi:hypothetical protein